MKFLIVFLLIFIHFFSILAKITDNMDGEGPVKVIQSANNIDHSKITAKPLSNITTRTTSPVLQEISTKVVEESQSGTCHLTINNTFILFFHWFVNLV